MTKFELLRSITDVGKFSEVIYEVLIQHKSPKEMEAFLSEELTEHQQKTLQSIVASGNYPLSFDGKQ